MIYCSLSFLNLGLLSRLTPYKNEIWGGLGHAHIQNLGEIYTVLLKSTFV